MTEEDFNEKSIPLAVAKHYAENDALLHRMVKRSVPLTRNAYMIMAGLEPDEDGALPAEAEMSVPECFRDPKQFSIED
jgi:hypothetical protein